MVDWCGYMLRHTAKRWREDTHAFSNFRSTLFSAPEHFKLRRADRRHLSVDTVEFPEIGTSLLSVVSSGHEINLADENFLTIMLPTQGVTKVRKDKKVHVIGEGFALAFGPSERLTQVDPRGHKDYRANLAKINLKDAHAAKTASSLVMNPVQMMEPSALAGFQGLIQYLFTDLASACPMLVHRPASDLFAALVQEHLRLVLQSNQEISLSDASSGGIVRRSIEYMEAFSSDPLTVPKIAGSVGVSTRRLQDAFRIESGRTPWEQLTEIRLRNARVMLLSGAGYSVTDIALDCGFSHLGRFSQAYRVTYGEAPSATLARFKAAKYLH